MSGTNYILLVEDDVTQGEEMADFLGRAGLAVSVANSGAAAIRIAEANAPRIALIDYNLLDANGIELAERLRDFLPDTKIFLMSGRIPGVAKATLDRLNITDFLSKPLPLISIREKIARLMNVPDHPG